MVGSGSSQPRTHRSRETGRLPTEAEDGRSAEEARGSSRGGSLFKGMRLVFHENDDLLGEH